MTLTLEELKEKMAATLSEVAIIELLNLTSADLVEYLSEVIEDNYDVCISEIEQLEEPYNED